MTYYSAAGLTHDRIYCELDRFRRDGTKRAILRVSASPALGYGARPKVHVREWVQAVREPGYLIPCRGIALSLDELDGVIYSLCLARDDAQRGRLATAATAV